MYARLRAPALIRRNAHLPRIFVVCPMNLLRAATKWPKGSLMTKLWQKGYRLHEQVERFEAAQNSLLDARLIRHDVWGSLAHVAMLTKIGVLTEAEHKVLQDTLRSILQLEASHEFIVTVADEDVHTGVENYLAATAGAAGKKNHMSRRRNEHGLGEPAL